MTVYRDMLQKLISAGHLRRLPPAEWFALTEEDCRVLCGKALRNPPLTCAPATQEQKNLLRSDLALGLLPGLYASDIPHLTADEAEILLGISAERRFTHAAPYHEILKRELRDTEPAAPEQLRQIRTLIREKRLRPISERTLLKISHLSARRLIWRGEMNRREAQRASFKPRI